MKTIITKTLVFSLLSTFAIGLSSCNNKKEIKYLDHSDYGTTLKSNVCTTVMYDNANYYYDICNNLKVKSQFSTFDPFVHQRLNNSNYKIFCWQIIYSRYR